MPLFQRKSAITQPSEKEERTPRMVRTSPSPLRSRSTSRSKILATTHKRKNIWGKKRIAFIFGLLLGTKHPLRILAKIQQANMHIIKRTISTLPPIKTIYTTTTRRIPSSTIRTYGNARTETEITYKDQAETSCIPHPGNREHGKPKHNIEVSVCSEGAEDVG